MKLRITVTTIKEYDTPPVDCYPEGSTEEDILRMETEGANDDPFLAAEGGSTTVVVEKIV